MGVGRNNGDQSADQGDKDGADDGSEKGVGKGQAVRQNAHNSSLRSRLRTAIKAVRKAIAQGDKAVAKVRFLAELRRRIQAAGGSELIDERRTAELWTFERKLTSGNPNWSLARTQPAEA